MKVVDLSKVIREDAGVMAFGFFDSIHVGHRQVISQAVSLAHTIGCVASVFLFKNNIYPLLGMEKYPIYTFDERLALIADLGVDVVYFVDADKQYLSMSKEAFLSDISDKLSLKGFTCGKDFPFGAGGLGGVVDLISFIGGTYTVLDLAEAGGEKVSSERVRAALRVGDLRQVRAFLGREFSVLRTVVHGRSDGAKLGFPTLNTPLLTVPLLEGVYFTTVTVDGTAYRAVTNVGTHPTFGDMNSNIESFILDFDRDLYGKEIKLTFLSYHRRIERFSDVAALKERIAQDVAQRRLYD